MTERTEDIAGVARILWAARIDTVADRWHLDERAAPRLAALAQQAGEPRLHQAVEHTTKAGEHLAAAQDTLRDAIKLVEACLPAGPAQAVE